MDPKPELTSLPDVPSRAIVSLLPLQQVITTLPLLHSRFAPIRESFLKGNQRLVLYIGDLKKINSKKCRSQLGVPFASQLVDSNGSHLSPDTSFHRLHLLTLSQHSVEQLSTLMPNLTYLEVAIASVDISVIPHLITLLTFWGPTLQTLKLLIREFKPVNDEHLQLSYLPTVASHLCNLIRLINTQLLALESLSLDLDDSLIDRYQECLNQKVKNSVIGLIRHLNGHFNRLLMQAIDNDDAIQRLNVLLKEVTDFLNQEPPTEAINAEEVFTQARNLGQLFWSKVRFNSEVLFKEEKDGTEPIHCLSILGRLKEFSFETGQPSPSMQTFILKALEEYGSSRLTSISIGRDAKWGNTWNLPAFANSPFASQFTRFPLLYISWLTPTTQQIHELNEHHGVMNDTPFLPLFTNLKVYTVKWCNLSPNQMARLCALASLPNLQCLQLDGFRKNTPLLKANFAKLPPFSSVTVLEISISHYERNPYQTHACLQAPYWAHLFPSVQVIKITQAGNLCRSCFLNKQRQGNLKIEGLETVLPCLKQLIAPLRELPSLRKIFYQKSGQIDGIAEFTPEGELTQTHEYVY